jgi:hypothetical protein
MSSYLPAKEADLVDWSDNFVTVLTANAAAWEVPAAEVTALTGALNTFKPLHEQATGPDSTAVIVEQKNEAKAALVTLIRNMVNYRLANPAVVGSKRPRRFELGVLLRKTPLVGSIRSRAKTETPHGTATQERRCARVLNRRWARVAGGRMGCDALLCGGGPHFPTDGSPRPSSFGCTTALMGCQGRCVGEVYCGRI